MQNRHLFGGKLHKEIFDMNTSIEDFRAKCEKRAQRAGNLPEGVEVINEPNIGLPAEWIVPEGAKPDTMVLYVHGGGYVSGSCSDHRNIVAKFAYRCEVRILLYEYRQIGRAHV